MTRQFDLLEPEAPLARRFRQFDEQNPHIYDAIFSFAMAEVSRGRKRIAIAEVIETARARLAAEYGRAKGEKYKVNNSFRAFYARKLIAERPDLFAGVIETRRQKAV